MTDRYTKTVLTVIAGALIYLCITLISNQIFGWLERRVRRGQPKLA